MPALVLIYALAFVLTLLWRLTRVAGPKALPVITHRGRQAAAGCSRSRCPRSGTVSIRGFGSAASGV